MDTWFQLAQSYFEVFLEMKLDTYGSAVASLEHHSPDNSPMRRGKEWSGMSLSSTCSSTASSPKASSGKVSASLAEAAAVGSSLKALPTEYIDAVHEMCARTYLNMPECYDVAPTDDTVGGGSGDEKDLSLLYGELTPRGVRQLLALLKKHVSPNSSSNRPGVFADFGCGTGKILFELALLLGGGFGSNSGDSGESDDAHDHLSSMRLLGVELVPERAQVATVATQLLADLPAACPVKIVCDSFLTVPSTSDSSALDAVFCCGVGFDEAMTRKILDRLWEFRSTLQLAVLLFKHWPQDHPLLNNYSCPANHHDADNDASVMCGIESITVEKINISATWMDEAPAVTVSIKHNM